MYLHSQHFSLLQETINTGPFVMRSTCRRCGGRGSIITNPCVVCRGAGQAKQKKRVTVPVPAGDGPALCACHLHDYTVRHRPRLPEGRKTQTLRISLYTSHLYTCLLCSQLGMLQLLFQLSVLYLFCLHIVRITK